MTNQQTLSGTITCKDCQNQSKSIITTPFVKWAGGKRGIMDKLVQRMPNRFNNYYEPFVGGGAVFFTKRFNNANLSDLNSDLIITYNVIKSTPFQLISLLKEHNIHNCEKYFYNIRSKHNLINPIEIAARFIYLNKTCFNGLYRVNKSGEFNVPYGKHKNPNIIQEENILACNTTLQNTVICHHRYTDIKPKDGDFVYFDPPYYPINEKYFTTYTKYGFSKNDHIELHDFALKLCDNGVKIMISNSNTDFIRKLYNTTDFNVDTILAPRYISCNGDRKPAEELIITGGY